MTPLFFGDSNAPLFGVYHGPSGRPRNEGVLLCYPFGQEYMRAHRANRQLAMLLAKQGFHVLRFDYQGTGNSAGLLAEATVEVWINNIQAAAEELKETAGIDHLHLVGLRLGALLGAKACQDLSIDRLVLWDPVNSGSAYEDELQQVMHLGDEAHNNFIDDDGTLYFNGFGLSSALRQGLAEIDLLNMTPGAKQVLHIVSSEYPSALALKDAWQAVDQYQYSLTEAPGDWNYVDDFGGILLPQPIIQAIVGWFGQEG